MRDAACCGGCSPLPGYRECPDVSSFVRLRGGEGSEAQALAQGLISGGLSAGQSERSRELVQELLRPGLLDHVPGTEDEFAEALPKVEASLDLAPPKSSTACQLGPGPPTPVGSQSQALLLPPPLSRK